MKIFTINLLILFCHQAIAQTIISENFDTGTMGVFQPYVNPDTAEVTTERSFSIAYSLKIVGSRESGFDGVKSSFISFKKGRYYRISAMVYAAVIVDSLHNVAINENHKGATAFAIIANAWHYISATFKATANVSTANMFLFCKSGAKAYFDDVKLEELPLNDKIVRRRGRRRSY